MLTSIDVKFIFDSARLGLFSSANILQIVDVALRVDEEDEGTFWKMRGRFESYIHYFIFASY